MIDIVIIIGLFIVFFFLGYFSYSVDKQNRIRYESILHRLKPGVKYPYWRLEEMLKEEMQHEKHK